MTKLKGYTDLRCRRHYFYGKADWRLSETDNGKEVILTLLGSVEYRIDRKEAKQIGKLLKHFAKFGNLPVPREQEPL